MTGTEQRNSSINKASFVLSTSMASNTPSHERAPTSMQRIVNAEITRWLSNMGYSVHAASPDQLLHMLAEEAAQWGLTAEQLTFIILGTKRLPGVEHMASLERNRKV